MREAIRETMRRLSAEGLVTIDAHRRARVTRLTAEEARNLFEVRERLGPLAAGPAARLRTPEEPPRHRRPPRGLARARIRPDRRPRRTTRGAGHRQDRDEIRGGRRRAAHEAR
jgi:hypothetical protein